MFGRKIRIGSKFQRCLVESIISFFGLLPTTVPSLVSRHELLFDNRRAIGTLRSISVDVNVAHLRNARERRINKFYFIFN